MVYIDKLYAQGNTFEEALRACMRELEFVITSNNYKDGDTKVINGQKYIYAFGEWTELLNEVLAQGDGLSEFIEELNSSDDTDPNTGESIDTDTQDPQAKYTDGAVKINKAEEILNASTDPRLVNLLEKTKDYPLVKQDKVLENGKERNGLTKPSSTNPLIGSIELSTERAKFRTFLEVLNTVIHEKGHAYLFYVENTPDNQLSVQDLAIKTRLLEIKNSVLNSDGTTNISGFEGIKFTAEEFAELKAEGQHIAIVEFFVEEMAEILKELVIANPEVFGTIDDSLINDIRTFQAIAAKSEFGKREVPSISLSPFTGLSTYYRQRARLIESQLKK